MARGWLCGQIDLFSYLSSTTICYATLDKLLSFSVLGFPICEIGILSAEQLWGLNEMLYANYLA